MNVTSLPKPSRIASHVAAARVRRQDRDPGFVGGRADTAEHRGAGPVRAVQEYEQR